MPFLKIDANLVLNADAIDRIDFNHIRPHTQDRSIRIELRAIPGLAESRIVLMRYSPELEASLMKALHPQAITDFPVGGSTPLSFISLMRADWDNQIEDYAVCRIPCVGEYIVLWDHETSTSVSFQVERVCHEIPALKEGEDYYPASDDRKPQAILLVTPCAAPLSLYELRSARTQI